MRRYDPFSRAVFGALCVAGMAGVASPVLAVAGVVGGIVYATDGDGGKALAVWLGAWAAALFAALLFGALAYTAWPLASDWIVEWQGYAAGMTIGGAGFAFMAGLVFATDMPLYLAVVVPIAATVFVGFITPGRVLGLRPAPPRERQRPFRRKR